MSDQEEPLDEDVDTGDDFGEAGEDEDLLEAFADTLPDSDEGGEDEPDSDPNEGRSPGDEGFDYSAMSDAEWDAFLAKRSAELEAETSGVSPVEPDGEVSDQDFADWLEAPSDEEVQRRLDAEDQAARDRRLLEARQRVAQMREAISQKYRPSRDEEDDPYAVQQQVEDATVFARMSEDQFREFLAARTASGGPGISDAEMSRLLKEANDA
jgi:hypothetical protein